MLKFQLFNNSLGSVTLQTDPDGSNDFELRLKRSKKSDGVFYEFSIDLSFVKEGRKFVRDVFDLEGIDGIIGINIFIYDPNNYKFEREYSGQIKLTTYNLEEETVTGTVEEVGFKRKFINLEELDVDIGASETRKGIPITSDPFITLPLAPKTIKKKAILIGSNYLIESGGGQKTVGFNAHTRIGSEKNNSDFINTFLEVDVWAEDESSLPTEVSNFTLKVDDSGEAGNYVFDFSDLTFDLTVATSDIVGPGALTSWDIRLLYQKNDETPIEIFSRVFFPGEEDELDFPFPFFVRRYFNNYTPNINTVINDTLEIGDEIYIWWDSDIDFQGDGEQDKIVGYRLKEGSEMTITGDTVFPETDTKATLIYEFLEKICQVLTDRVDCFRSDYFGRTDSTVTYPTDGEGSLLAITNGRSIRQLETQTLFANWKEAYQSIESVHCIGWGFERLEDGTEIIRVEPKDYFYDKGTRALKLESISNLSIKVERDLYYQNISVGYPKVENINQVNGIDEFNTERKFASPVDQAKGELEIKSKYRASGFEIESQRRLINTTEESRIDDENFFVVVKRDGEGGYVVEQGSDFEVVTGIFDPDTAYNLRISPARNIRRWGKIIASNVIKKQDKSFKFTYGTFNYTATSKLLGEELIEESGNYDTTGIEPIYRCEVVEFESKLVRHQRNELRTYIYGFIEISEWEGNKIEGYLLDVKSGLESNKGIFTILRLFRF